MLSITFGVGGAGAQTDIAYTVAKSLREKIAKGEVRYTILAGVRPEVKEFVERMRGTWAARRSAWPGEPPCEEYFGAFTQTMRTTDILWTKPSELSFYCGLGIPLIMAPTIGSQEQFNRDWLLEIQAGVPQEDPRYTHQWLFDRLIAGRLADAAMVRVPQSPEVRHLQDHGGAADGHHGAGDLAPEAVRPCDCSQRSS